MLSPLSNLWLKNSETQVYAKHKYEEPSLGTDEFYLENCCSISCSLLLAPNLISASFYISSATTLRNQLSEVEGS